MDDERGRNWGRNDPYIRDVKFACNDSYLLIIDSDSYLFSVNISTSEWNKIKHVDNIIFLMVSCFMRTVKLRKDMKLQI